MTRRSNDDDAKAATGGARRNADNGDKDALARVWDAIAGERHAGRDERQDRMHSAIVFIVMLALATSIATLGAWLWHDHASYREDHVFVPAATYTSDQVDEVERQLEGMGFVDLSAGDTGVTAYGTHEMCDAWRSSFWDRNVSDAITAASMSSDTFATHMSSGVTGMRHSDDWTRLTISTLTSDPSVSVIGYMIESDQKLSDAIDAAANWCAVLHDGQRIGVSFVGQDGSEYLALDTDTASDIIVQLQQQAEGGDGTQGDATQNDTQ